MLPFLKNKNRVAEILTATRKPSGDIDTTSSDDSEGSDSSALESAAQDLISAIQGNDAQGAAQALRSAFQILDAEDESESPTSEE